MKRFLLLLLVSCFTLDSAAQIIVRNVIEKSFDKLDYPNHTGKVFSTQPQKGTLTLNDGSTQSGKLTFFKKDGQLTKVKVNNDAGKQEVEAAQIKTIKLDPFIGEQKHTNDYKNPEKNFQKGFIVTREGVKITGKIAQDRNLGDYDFFVYGIFFLPENSNVASVIRGGALDHFVQEINGVTITWDGYADGYVKRLVNGKYRLWRNPYSSTRNEFFTSIKIQTVDSVKKEAARRALEESLQNGEDINASIENSTNAVELMDALGAIEINKKEYLIADTGSNKVTVVNKDTYRNFAQSLYANCPSNQISNTEATNELLRWDKIESFLNYINNDCK